MAIKGRVRGGLDPAAGCAVECRDRRRRRLDVEQKVRFSHGRRVQGARGVLRLECRVGPTALGLEPVEKLEDVAELDVEFSSISHVRRRDAVREHIRERDYDRGSPAVGGRVSVVRRAWLAGQTPPSACGSVRGVALSYWQTCVQVCGWSRRH